MVGGSLRLLRFLPPLKLVTMILLKVALNTKKIQIYYHACFVVDSGHVSQENFTTSHGVDACDFKEEKKLSSRIKYSFIPLPLLALLFYLLYD
jgi:hypothetical protein